MGERGKLGEVRLVFPGFLCFFLFSLAIGTCCGFIVTHGTRLFLYILVLFLLFLSSATHGRAGNLKLELG